MVRRSLMAAGSVALLLVMAGCSTDSISTTIDDEQALATTFDGMSRDANGVGDADGGAAFSGAAMAIRLGVRPTAIEVSVNGESRRYLAFVHVLASSRALPVAAFRTLVAYRTEKERPIEVLYVAAGSDSVGLGHPMAGGIRPDPATFGVSSWKDLANRQFYVAASGLAMIKQQADAGSPCPKIPPRSTVTCTVVKFGLRVSGDYFALASNQRGQLDRSRKVTLSTRAADVTGAVLLID